MLNIRLVKFDRRWKTLDFLLRKHKRFRVFYYDRVVFKIQI